MELKLINARGLDKELEVSFYINSLPKGSVFYDLGACVGGFSLEALLKGLKVVSFEVEKLNFNQLNENYKLNKKLFKKDHYFKSFNIGIADKEGETILRIGQSEVGGHHKTLKLETYCASPHIIGLFEETVPISDLDTFIEKNNLPFPEYMKIDIDGSEYAFIQGAKITLSKVKSLIIELYQENEYFQKIHNDLRNLGFIEILRGNCIDRGGLHNAIFIKQN